MKRTLIILALAALALTGCNKEMAHKPIASNNDGELSVLPMQSNGSISTRGYVESTEFKETTYESLHSATKESVDRKMQISAYLYPQNGEQKNYFVDKTYAKGDDGLWHNTTSEGIDPIYWPVGGTLDFLAYSVSENDSRNITAVWNSEDAANDITLKVPAENSQNDILFASAYGIESRSSAQAVAMKFNHAQAWLEFVLTGSTDDVNTDGIVTLKRIELEKVYNAGTLAIDNNNGNATAKWNFTGEQRQNIVVDNCYGVAKLNAAPQYLDMLIPQQTKTAFVLYYTLGSSDKEHSYRFTTDQKTWLMGEKYVYSINIKTSEVTVEPSVTEWSGPVNEYNYNVIVKSNDTDKGTVEISDIIGGTKVSGEGCDIIKFDTWSGQATLKATPTSNAYGFDQWLDGCTDAERFLTVIEDAEYEAIFKDAISITVSVKESQMGRGAASAEHSVYYNKATLTATPTEGYKFFRWVKDGNEVSMENPYTVVAEEASAYVAEFVREESVRGLFSVAEDKQVEITSGNMYWDGDSFELESSQTAYPTSWDASHVGNFFWSSNASKTYAETFDWEAALKTDVFFTNDPSNQAKPNSSFKFNGKTNIFRVLSTDEWQYLLGNNANRNDLCRYGVNVEGNTNCLVIYPDEWTRDKVANNGTLTSIPDGVVVLPAIYYRMETTFYKAGSTGCYWSASPTSDEGFFSTAWRIGFDDNEVCSNFQDFRDAGCPVRLVSDAE